MDTFSRSKLHGPFDQRDYSAKNDSVLQQPAKKEGVNRGAYYDERY